MLINVIRTPLNNANRSQLHGHTNYLLCQTSVVIKYMLILVFLSFKFKLQGSKTLVHKLHDKQLLVMKDFLSCCVKSEHVATSSPKHLVKLDLPQVMLSQNSLYIGKVEEICSKHPEYLVDVVNFF